jgi:hypothetical protein
MQPLFAWLIPSLFRAQEPQTRSNQSLDMDNRICSNSFLDVDYTMNLDLPFPNDKNARTNIRGYPSEVIAYPSVGGLVLGYFSAVEMVHLHLPRFEPSRRSSNTDEEDELALRMLRLGAHWWPNPKRYKYHKEKMKDRFPYDYHFPPSIAVGYPSSQQGVWVLKFLDPDDNWTHEMNREPSVPKCPDGWEQKLSYVLTMNERCDALRDFGAEFYERIEDCEDIDLTLEGAVERGKGYDVLLRKMEDEEYVEKWIDSVVTAE